jgi:hypothetical protein
VAFNGEFLPQFEFAMASPHLKVEIPLTSSVSSSYHLIGAKATREFEVDMSRFLKPVGMGKSIVSYTASLYYFVQFEEQKIEAIVTERLGVRGSFEVVVTADVLRRFQQSDKRTKTD